jgi:Rieske Fe-S protein
MSHGGHDPKRESLAPSGAERRDWLRTILGLGLLSTIGVLLYPVFRFLKPRAGAQGGPQEALAPYRVSDLKPGSDGEWPKPFNFGGKPCLVIKSKDGEVRAFNAVCTHTDCTVKFRPKNGDIFCNCHSGVYDLQGRNVSGPPPRPLEKFKVRLRGSAGEEEIFVSA